VFRNFKRLHKVKPTPDIPRPPQINRPKSFSRDQQRLDGYVRAVKAELVVYAKFRPDRQPRPSAASYIKHA
jgi:hypothetical protein